MSELDKKYSDFQENECETQDPEAPIVEELCPTCTPNPSWKLGGYWWEMEEAYLDEKFCEYRVRIYAREKGEELTDERIVLKGIERIILHLKKTNDDSTRQSLLPLASVADKYFNVRSGMLGEAYLISLPAFNLDTLPEDDRLSDEEQQSGGLGSDGEILIEGNQFSDYIFKLQSSIYTYGIYYRSLQHVQSLVIKEEKSSQRIDYVATRKNIRSFYKNLNKTLKANSYLSFRQGGFFSAKKRVKKIKFVLEGSYNLKSVWVLPDTGCDEYEELNGISSLKSSEYAVVYNFLSNIEGIINDVTAKQTKSWLDFTLEYFYPKMIVDYGGNNADLTDEQRSGLACFLEQELGLGGGQVVDSLTGIVLSAFDKLQDDIAKEACRSIQKVSSHSPAAIAQEKEPLTPKEEREAAMVKRFATKHTNSLYKQCIDQAQTLNDIDYSNYSATTLTPIPKVIITRTNVFHYSPDAGFKTETRLPKHNGVFEDYINSKEKLKNAANNYAQIEWRNNGEDSFFGSMNNSPHWNDAQKTISEKYNDENSFLNLIKTEDEMTGMDFIPILGICGLSKMSGKALKCLLGGVEIGDFLDVMMEKTFEFMKINTFDVFLNGLPYEFKRDLNEAIEAEFGSGVSLSDLINLKKTQDNDASFKEFVQSPSTAKKVLNILEKYPPGKSLSKEDKEFLLTVMEKEDIAGHRDTTNDYYHGKDSVWAGVMTTSYYNMTSTSLSNPKKAIKGAIKRSIKNKKKPQTDKAMERIKDNLTITAPAGELPKGELNEYEKAVKNFEATALGTKVDVVYDVVFDFAIDYIKSSLAADELLDFLKDVPALGMVIDMAEDFVSSCPMPPLLYPPPGDFMKSLKVDVCDPTFQLTIPKIIVPNINPMDLAQIQFAELFREAIIKIISDIIERLLLRLLSALEGALCKALEAVGGFAVEGVKNGLPSIQDATSGGNFADLSWTSFVKSLNEAFCNDGVDETTSRQKAEQLADELFNPAQAIATESPEGAGARVSNIISSVASQSDFLSAMVADDATEEDPQFNKRIANAINALAPEFASLLGSPNQVAYFFRNLGSYLSPEDRERIRDLLDSGVPNLPISSAICLTNDQLEDWNNLREDLLRDLGLSPEDARKRVDDLNKKTIEALEDLLDDDAELQTEGPFVAPITNEMGKDPCNPNNIINTLSDSPLAKSLENKGIDDQYDSLNRFLSFGMFANGGLFGEALRDRNDNRTMKRGFLKLFNPNYGNSLEEQATKFSEKGKIGQFVMNTLGEDEDGDGIPDVVGDFPMTVGIKLRKELVDDATTNIIFDPEQSFQAPVETEDSLKKMRVVFFDNIEYTLKKPVSAKNITYMYEEGEDAEKYKNELCISQNNYKVDSLDYHVQLIDTLGSSELAEEPEFSFNCPVSLNLEEEEFLKERNFQLETNQEQDIRKNIFGKILSTEMPINKDLKDLYQPLYEDLSKKLVTGLFTNPDLPESIPMGFQFGYVSEDLKTEDFEYLNPDGSPYNKPEDEQILGKYGNPRIVVLDPNLYGGRYSNPPYYIEPRTFYGWVELATKAFGGDEGCDPKSPPIFNLGDIKERVKRLKDRIPPDPRLGQDPDCTPINPFHSLHNNKIKAMLDGNLRTIIRVYLGEYYLRGAGTFLNLEARDENYDSGLFMYLAENMKKEMIESGLSINRKSITIKKEKYWYTFLEQVVEMYQRKIDMDQFIPPENIATILDNIQKGIDRYEYPTREVKKRMIKNKEVDLPGRELTTADISDSKFHHWAISYRIYGEKMFHSTSSVKYGSMRLYALKKIRFFSKILFIRIYEQQCMTILSEVIKEELLAISKSANDTLTNKPYIYDLYKSFFGMTSIFPGTTSKVGLWSYYLEKQKGAPNAGAIPEVSKNLASFSMEEEEEPQLIIESYVRLKEKELLSDTPDFVKNRSPQYRGVVSLTEFSNFIDENISFIDNKNISDCFGDLTFSYSVGFKDLMNEGFTDATAKTTLLKLNPDKLAQIQNSLRKHMTSRPYDDFDVLIDETLVKENSSKTPSGTIGETGIKYGLRVSLLFPKGYLSDDEKQNIRNNNEFITMARKEKAFLFNDGKFLLPISSAEVDAIDQPMSTFNLFGSYDLECLINKMVTLPEFTIFFDKLMNVRQISSSLSIYCIQNFAPSIGGDEDERAEVDDPDDWDRSINKFVKGMLRREFGSLYLSNTQDIYVPEEPEDEASKRMRMSNPLAALKMPPIKIPWFRKRRLIPNATDANGIDCANPSKDLEE